MTTPVQTHMVQNITVSETCSRTRPCLHDCTITLTGGLKKTVTLGAHDIAVLIDSSIRSKIFCNKAHFRNQKKSDALLVQVLTQMWNQPIKESLQPL